MDDIRTRFLEAYGYLLREGFVTGYKNFASKISVSTSMITEISKGRSNVGMTAIQNIVLVFPINADWLLTGRGKMLCDTQEHSSLSQQEVISDDPTKIVQIFMAKLDEKETKIEELNERVIELTAQLARACPEGLATAKTASIKKHSSRKTQSANSDNAHSHKP